MTKSTVSLVLDYSGKRSKNCTSKILKLLLVVDHRPLSPVSMTHEINLRHILIG
jgi:hypothetical protein